MSFLPVMQTCCLGLMLIAAGITRAHGADLDMTIAVPPTPVRVEGHQQLDYEVQLTNHSGHRLTLEEFASWQRAVDRSGMQGLRVTRIQHYRDLYERQLKY